MRRVKSNINLTYALKRKVTITVISLLSCFGLIRHESASAYGEPITARTPLDPLPIPSKKRSLPTDEVRERNHENLRKKWQRIIAEEVREPSRARSKKKFSSKKSKKSLKAQNKKKKQRTKLAQSKSQKSKRRQ